VRSPSYHFQNGVQTSKFKFFKVLRIFRCSFNLDTVLNSMSILYTPFSRAMNEVSFGKKSELCQCKGRGEKLRHSFCNTRYQPVYCLFRLCFVFFANSTIEQMNGTKFIHSNTRLDYMAICLQSIFFHQLIHGGLAFITDILNTQYIFHIMVDFIDILFNMLSK
jgi:hypothetical protein